MSTAYINGHIEMNWKSSDYAFQIYLGWYIKAKRSLRIGLASTNLIIIKKNYKKGKKKKKNL